MADVSSLFIVITSDYDYQLWNELPLKNDQSAKFLTIDGGYEYALWNNTPFRNDQTSKFTVFEDSFRFVVMELPTPLNRNRKFCIPTVVGERPFTFVEKSNSENYVIVLFNN